MTAISGVKAVIGGGGDFSAPIFRQQAKTIMQECGAGGYTVFMAIALNTDFRPDSRTFLRCSLTGKKGVTRFTGMSYNAVDRNLTKLVEHGWVTTEDKSSGTVFWLNGDKLSQVYADGTGSTDDAVPSEDVEAVLTVHLDVAPAGTMVNRQREAGIIRKLLQRHSADEIIGRLRELVSSGKPVYTMEYVKRSFDMDRKRGTKKQPAPAPTPRKEDNCLS